MASTLPKTDSGAARFFPAFALIWACTTLIHQLAFSFWIETWDGWLLVIATFGVILEPACFRRFLGLVVASLLHFAHKLPFVPNHILYEGMLHLTMLLGVLGMAVGGSFGGWGKIASSCWRRCGPVLIAIGVKMVCFQLELIPESKVLGVATTLLIPFAYGLGVFRGAPLQRGEAFFQTIAPVIRAAVVMMYFWAVLQKLNFDYLDWRHSCAAKLHVDIAGYFPDGLVPTAVWALDCAIWGSLIFETGIPILLIFSRFRFLGFLAALAFHLWLSIHYAAGIYSFSSIVLALLYFFVPGSVAGKLAALWERQLLFIGRGDIGAGRRLARWSVIIIFMGAIITQALHYLLIERSYDVFWRANRVGFFVWLTWGLWLAACYLVSVWQCRRLPRDFSNRPKPTLAWLGLILILVNGINPWIGLKTQTSFSMYSNLRSEGAGNHLFFRRIDLFPFQADMIELIGSKPDLLSPTNTPKGIQQFANEGNIFPHFELRRMLSEREGDVEVVYRRVQDQQLLKASRKGSLITGDPELFERPPIWWRKTLWFRRHQSLEGPMHCTH